MVESRRRIPKGAFEQKSSLTERLENAGLNAEQRKAKDIIESLDLSSPDLPPDTGALLFLCFLWHESGSLSRVKKITGITNSADAHSLVNRVGESDKLTKQYEEFYLRYRAQVPGGII